MQGCNRNNGRYRKQQLRPGQIGDDRVLKTAQLGQRPHGGPTDPEVVGGVVPDARNEP